ncbi:MAG: carboxypeptidase-like regulatory domain-containing protein [Fibromonadales bacterium]|nr:carboxypeptidase-like regulatory domain-containing protein [Fibromonadales bacterium]
MILFVLFILAVTLHAVPMRGVAVEEATDMPIPYANITYVSGKALGQSDDKGRFEFELESRNAVLVFKKNGFDSTIVEMQDFADLLDIVVSMRSNAKHLGSTTVIGGGGEAVWQNPKAASMQKLEDAAGLRFDLAEHLSQMPGMSGQMDFSSNLFYDGSRAEEVAYHFGLLRIPNMRHLDIGFPGNLSVINPHAIANININEHYGASPFNQGLAGSVQFEPREADDFRANISLGTTLREIYMEGSHFAVSARYLDPSMLKNMGEKFFTEFKKKDDSCDNCEKENNSFSTSAMDLYARVFGSDSGHNAWAVSGLYASDKYSIRQNSTTIIHGSQVYGLASAEYKTFNGTNFYIGFVSQKTTDTLSDTSAFRKVQCQNGLLCENNFIDGHKKSHLTASSGISWEQTDNLGFALLYDFHNLDALKDNVGQASAYYKIGRGTLGAGGIFSLHSKQAMPLASFDVEKEIKKDFSIFSTTAWRSDWHEGELNGGASLKAGSRFSLGGLEVSAHGFGRYYPSPILPTPLAFERYKELQSTDFGWVSGAQVTFDFHALHRFAFQSNISSIYGEYELPNGHSLPWQANSRLDMVSHFRIYPRSDSLVSFIVSHRAALNRPLYEWYIDPVQEQRHIKYTSETMSLFRTDIRFNLDLKSKIKILFLENVRFFVEADNIFSSLDVGALRFLGADNARERSAAVRDKDGNSANGFDIVPFMAKGMGLYLQFGVEGNFGI